jgi:UDP:flavonoid glycosyltransferase YjiC (YdhE family)
VPYSALFPRAAAIVHQGGIGTLAQALRAGSPQIVVPFHGDQLDNGARAERLGVARVILRKQYRAKRAIAELQKVLGYTQAAAQVGAQIGREDGAAAAAAAITQVLRSRFFNHP